MPHANGGREVARPNGRDDDVRILRRLEIKQGPTGEGDVRDTHVCTVVDVETTGVDHENDRIIQLALRRLRYDGHGLITNIDRSYSWFEDPGEPISPEIQRLTGITDEMVAGKEIDGEAVTRMLTHSSLVVAHNAAFDRKWIEKRLPEAANLAWGCSMAEIDWPGRGFDGRKLGFLGMQCGWYFDAHRAEADVDAVIGLLRHRFDDGRPAMGELLENAERPSWLIRAYGAAFEQKDRLRCRGYRWDAKRKVWAKEVRDDHRIAEEFWLAANIYCVEAHPRALGPQVERIDRWCRYA